MSKIRSLFLTLCIMLAFASPSMAALSLGQQAVVDATTAQVTDLTAMAWVLVLSVLGSLVGIKLFKKFFSRSV